MATMRRRIGPLARGPGGVPAIIAAICALWFRTAAAESYCSSTTSWTIGECTGSGDVFLKGQYTEIGIHRAGSYGTATHAPSIFQASKASNNDWKRLGFMCDYGRDGWTIATPSNAPKYAGDFFVPGSPYEGFVIQYTSGSTTTKYNNLGLMDYYQLSKTTMHVTSHDNRQSVFWVGQQGNLQVMFDVTFDNQDRYFTTSVIVRNIGTTQLTNVHYMRTVDTDQEAQLRGDYTALYWVKYQPFQSGDTPGKWEHPTDPNLALVMSRGQTWSQLVLGLGTSHPNARVGHGGSDWYDPVKALTNNGWRTYGGKDVGPENTNDKQSANHPVQLVFKFPTLDVGATLEFDFAYVLSADELEIAMDYLKAIKILQPTDIISGTQVLFSIQVNDKVTFVDEVVYSMYARKIGDPSPAWHTLSTVSVTGPQREKSIFSITFDSTLYVSAQYVHLKAEVKEFNVEKRHTKLKPTSLNNNGALMCFNVPDPTNVPFYIGQLTALSLVRCPGYGGDFPSKVQFYREVYLLGNQLSELIGTDSNSADGFNVNVNVDGLPKDLQIVIKAKSTLGSDVTTTTVVGPVSEPNYAPAAITLSSSVVAENSALLTTIGAFTVSDQNAGDSHTLTLVSNPGNKFGIVGNNLVVNGNIDYEATPTITIQVKADDGHPQDCCVTQQFIITVLNVNEQPNEFTPSSVNVNEDHTVNTAIATLSATDPDGHAVTFSVLGDTSRFDMSGNSVILKKALNYELDTNHDLTIRITDTGSPVQTREQQFYVTVLDVNEAPTNIVLDCTSDEGCKVDENSDIGHLVATLSAADEDLGQTHTFSIVGTSVFNIAGDRLEVATNIDYEQIGASISVTIKVQDNGTPAKSFTKSLSIQVVDVDEPPQVNQAECYVDEDRFPGDTVTSTTWSEICMLLGQTDDNTALAYSISPAQSTLIDDKFVIQECSGLFFINGELDYEKRDLYEFNVTVVGAGGSSTQGTAIIHVVDVNEKPVLAAAAVEIDENVPVGTVIVPSLNTTDSDDDPSTPFCCDLLYEIVSGDTNPSTFEIEAATGKITLASTGILNHEAVDLYLLTVRVTDEGGLWTTNTVTIGVNNLNEAPVLNEISGTLAFVPENSAVGVALPVVLTASDQDEGTELTYSIQGGNTDDAFIIITEEQFNTKVGKLKVNNPSALDFETNPTFDLLIRVTDNGISSDPDAMLYDEAVFRIELQDVNEVPTLPATFTFNIAENSPANTVLGAPLGNSLADVDAGDTHTWVIVNYGGDEATKTFAVQANNGQLYVNQPVLNYEAVPSYTYTIRATDKGGLYAETTVTINVDDVNETPLVMSVDSVSISEAAEIGDFVATGGVEALELQGYDDDNDPLTFTITTANVPFDVSPVPGNPTAANINLTAPLNYEAKASYPITVRVSDGVNTATTSFTITIVDANDAPVLTDKTCSMAEDTTPNSDVCTFSASDQDSTAGPWGQHEYSLVSAIYHADGGDEDVTSFFDVPFANNLGTLKLTEDISLGGGNFYFAVNKTVDVEVLVTDGGLNDTAIISVLITETNRPPTCTPGQTFTVAENSISTTFVGTLDAEDPNEDEFTVTLVSGNLGGVFSINPTTRVITVANAALNFEAMPTYSLAISMTDPKGASSVCLVTVNLIDVNEAVTFTNQVRTVDENIPAGPLTSSGSPLAPVQASDPDVDDQHPTWSMVPQDGRPESENPIAINETSGELYLKENFTLNYEGADRTYIYIVTWSSRDMEATATLTVNVLNMPEPPVILSETITLPETATGVIGRVNAIDPDFEGTILQNPEDRCEDNCGLRYSILDGAFGSFSIDINTGQISVTAGGLDYENRAAYTLTVRVIDENGFGTAITNTVTVVVTDVSDCAVQNLFLLNGNASMSPIFTTTGGEILRINGRDFGPTKNREALDLTITVSYRDKSSTELSSYRYDALNCMVDPDADLVNADIYCEMAPGVGKNLGVVVTVSTVYSETESTVCTTSFSTAKLSYASPVISGMANHDNMPTQGGSAVVITGSDFGPIATNNVVTAKYGPTASEYTASCEIVVPHTQIRCTSVAGIGKDLSWVVQVAGQTSPPQGGSKYAEPAITAVTGTMNMQTSGGQPITLTGTNFGGLSSVVTVTYGSATTPVYTASGCVVSQAHTQVRCTTAPGYGSSLQWRVTVGAQTSAPSTDTTSYMVPVIDSVTGPGSFRANTDGGQIVLIAGSQFGPKYSSGEYDHVVVTYGPTGHEYTAASCRVSASHTQLECVTVPGTGKDHSWLVQIGDQTSALFGAMTSYSPPIVAYYLGAGSTDADTEGGQSVTVMGANFGNDNSKVDRVTYSSPNGTVFDAQDCAIVVEHTTIRCTTVPGAGENLHWVVTVDGQDSEAPSTSYASPLLMTITGAGAVDASVYGGQPITLLGDYFGPPDAKTLYGKEFLEAVTYGEAGTEYRAQNCVVISHQEIRCKTAPGVGKDLRWQVTVAGQTSDLSTLTTNYKAPIISSINPTHFSTAGGAIVTIDGSNFATFQMPTLLFNGVQLTPSYSPGEDRLLMTIPEGFGTGIQIQVVVGGQPSNVRTFNYDPPVITTVNTKAAENSTITLIVLGKSFSREPVVTIENDGIQYSVYCPLRTHDQITCFTAVAAGYVTVHTPDGRHSDPRYYEYGEARVLYSNLEGGDPITDGGARLRIICQYCGDDENAIRAEIGGRECDLDGFLYAEPTSPSYNSWAALADKSAGFDKDVALQEVYCIVPEGEGLRNSIVITRNDLPSLGCGCDECSLMSCFDYLPPTVDSISATSADTDSRLHIVLTGSNFGINPAVLVGPQGASASALLRDAVVNSLAAPVLETQSWHVLNSTHHEVIVEVKEYEGKDLTVTMSVANQTYALSEKFSYNPPVLHTSNKERLRAGTQGSNQTITITGDNFGVLGPQLYLNGIEQYVEGFDHHWLSFVAPPGVGKDLEVSVVVGGQLSIPEDPNEPIVFSYETPEIFDVWPVDLTSDTKGGRLSDPPVIVTIVGDNFGLQSMEWNLVLKGQSPEQTDVPVTNDDIVFWNHTHIEFYVPEGQGENKRLILTIGGQEALASDEYFFSYTPPQVYNILPIANPTTDGGYFLTINGTSFGVQGASVIIEDPLANSTNDRMSPTLCELQSQTHERVVCKVPRGVGADLRVTLTVDSRSDWTTFSYAAPVIEFFSQSRGGDASGGEVLKIYGMNLGPWRTPVRIFIGDVECPNSEWLADDRLNSFQPYLKCPLTPETTAGIKNVTVQVAYQTSEPNGQFQVECKRGYFGGEGEFCVDCGNPEQTGFVCDVDGLYLPVSAPGWWRIMQSRGSQYCPKEVRQRDSCPSMWPCEPSDACLGNNTCSKKYDPTSERCSECAEGYFRLNEECRKCPDQPWVIVLSAVIVLGTGGYMAHKLNQKRVNLGILSIGVDFFQVLAIFATTTEWPSELVDLYNTLSAFNLNIDLSAPECWDSVSFTYKQKWIVIECFPLFLMTIALMMYFGKYAYKRFIKRRRARLQSHLPALIGFVFTFMYYVYLYITTTTLAVFNCQPTQPSDGNRYMAAVGTSEGICYKEGSMQQELQPWAILAFIVYVIGFPALVGTILFRSKTVAIRDQLLRAARKGPREVKAAGTYAFRKRYHRLYFQFKPQFFFWILLILARKFMLGVTALLFRDNVIFLLSMTLLTMFIAYALEVRFQPYMSTADYDKIAADNADALNQILTADMIRIDAEKMRKLHKKARIDDFSDLSRFRPQMTYFHDYNVVESVLLFVIVLVNLSGIMFESGQLGHIQTKALTYFIILIVSASIAYFMWVLFSEVWIAFYPNKPLFGMKLEVIKEEDDPLKEEDIQFEYASSSMLARANSSDFEAEILNKDASLAKQEDLIRQQKEEITKLKRELSSKGGITAKPTVVKKKKDFASASSETAAPGEAIQLVRFGGDGTGADASGASDDADASRSLDVL